MATPVRAADILILSPTVTGGTSSIEYTTATGLGYTVDLVPAGPGANTWPTPPQPYSSYKAIILGDPTCGGVSSVAAAEANSAGVAGWAAAVTGNVVIIGTDPTFHQAQGGAQLWKSSIGFAAAGPGTGAVIALSCYYGGAAANTGVPVLKGFESTGTFTVQGGIPCAGDVAIVAASPALTGLTGGPVGTLSAWSCSVHEGFNSWDPSFIPLAIATDVPAALKTFPKGAPKGFPYILARGKTLVPVDDSGILKVCKVAGVGVAVGTPFTFTAGSSTFTVPAGPAPGGTCVVGPTFPVGSIVTVDEVVPPGHLVSSIGVAPPSQLVPGSINLAAGSVAVTIGSGVTEVTFTDKRTGYVEICKRGRVTGSFTFTVNPGSLGPFVVPAGACSPAIEVAAGSVTIRETTTGATIVGCDTIPVVSNQLSCNTPPQTSVVNVVPGDVSTMTIAFITNGRFVPTDGAALPTHTHAMGTTSMTLACTPNPAPLRSAVICTARVAAGEPKTRTPTGAVAFREGGTTLATVQLGNDGTAAFSSTTLAAGSHAILASYSGDAVFAENNSQSSVTVAQP